MVEKIYDKFTPTLSEITPPKKHTKTSQKLHIKEVLIVSVIIGALLSSFVMKKTETLEHRLTTLEKKIITLTK